MRAFKDEVQMTISIIAALGTNRAIGRSNSLLWHLPGDLPRFKRLTMGHAVIMGRKTFASIGKPLPGRQNIVITRNRDFMAEGVTVSHCIEDALTMAAASHSPNDELFIIGGGELYAQTLNRADKLYLTEVYDAPSDADTFFPTYTAFSHVLTSEEHKAGALRYRFTVRTRPDACDLR